MKTKFWYTLLVAHSLLFLSSDAQIFAIDKTLLPGPEYPLSNIPLFDQKINGLSFLRNKLVIKFQMRCVLFAGPCDLVGRWLKPRVEKIFLEGKCESCTPTQIPLVYEWLDKFSDSQPALFRAGVAKYLEIIGIRLPKDERRKMVQLLGEDLY